MKGKKTHDRGAGPLTSSLQTPTKFTMEALRQALRMAHSCRKASSLVASCTRFSFFTATSLSRCVARNTCSQMWRRHASHTAVMSPCGMLMWPLSGYAPLQHACAHLWAQSTPRAYLGAFGYQQMAVSSK